MRVLVTGAAGLVGRALMPYMLAQGHEVAALVRHSSDIRFYHPRLLWHVGDVRDKASLEASLVGVDYVVHLAAAKSDEAESHETNVVGAQHLIEASEKHGVKGIVNFSTISTKLGGKGRYATTKAAADVLFSHSRAPVITLRPSVVYGDAHSGVIGSLVRFTKLPLVPVIGSGEATYQPIHAADVAMAVEKVLTGEWAPAEYELGGPDTLSFNELARAVAHLMNGKRATLLHLPLWFALILARLFSILKHPPITVSNVLGSKETIVVDTKPFNDRYQLHPRSFTDGLQLIKKEEEKYTRESYALMSYVLGTRASDQHAALYEAATSHLPAAPLGTFTLKSPLRIGALDAMTRITGTPPEVRKKFINAAALAECSTATASLLPHRVSWGHLLGRFIAAGATTTIKILYGALLFGVPSLPAMPDTDVIVIGSGLSGLHAAYPIVKAGLKVMMLDVGFTDAAALEEGSAHTFAEHRKLDPAQHELFLGKDLSGIAGANDHASAMTTGRRAFVVQGAKEFAPTKNNGTVITQSFAQGGLSEAWGGVCDMFDNEELEAVGIPESLDESYRTVAAHIGVSGSDASLPLMPPAKLDDNHQKLSDTYESKRSRLTNAGFSLRAPLLALLTQDLGSRKATQYRDMDFWDNIGRSVYRGHFTLEALRTHANFSYQPNTLVSTVHTENGGATVVAHSTLTKEKFTFNSKVVIMAAGALNTNKILLRSFQKYDTPVPVLLKNNFLVPSLYFKALGKSQNPERHSLCQLVMHSLTKKFGMSDTYVQLYSYNSLLLYKLLRYVPLPIPEAFSLLSLLAPAIVLADVRLPSTESDTHYLMLRKDKGEYIEVQYPYREEERAADRVRVRKAMRALRTLGLFPLRAIENPFGATSHYAGGIPYRSKPTSESLSVDEKGRLNLGDTIYVADTSTWSALPAKPPALTIMANAERIGRHVVKALERIQ